MKLTEYWSEGQWLQTDKGWERDPNDFWIEDEKLYVMLDRSEYVVAEGPDNYLKAMAYRYTELLEKVLYDSTLEPGDVLLDPEKETIQFVMYNKPSGGFGYELSKPMSIETAVKGMTCK